MAPHKGNIFTSVLRPDNFLDRLAKKSPRGPVRNSKVVKSPKTKRERSPINVKLLSQPQTPCEEQPQTPFEEEPEGEKPKNVKPPGPKKERIGPVQYNSCELEWDEVYLHQEKLDEIFASLPGYEPGEGSKCVIPCEFDVIEGLQKLQEIEAIFSRLEEIKIENEQDKEAGDKKDKGTMSKKETWSKKKTVGKTQTGGTKKQSVSKTRGSEAESKRDIKREAFCKTEDKKEDFGYESDHGIKKEFLYGAAEREMKGEVKDESEGVDTKYGIGCSRQNSIEIHRPATESDHVGYIGPNVPNLNPTTFGQLYQWQISTAEYPIGIYNTETPMYYTYTGDVYSPSYDITHGAFENPWVQGSPALGSPECCFCEYYTYHMCTWA